MTFPFRELFAEYIKNEVPVSQALSDYTPRDLYSEPDFTETPKTFQITLTGEQYLKIMSSLFTGAWLVYPEEWLEVYASFWQGIKIMDCEFIADCIANNEGVQNAIADYLSGIGNGGIPTGAGSGAGTSTPVQLTGNPTNVMAGGACDNDNMYAVATRISQLAFDTVNQLYQVLDLAISPLELAAEVGDNLPAISTGVPTTAADWLIWVQDTAADSFGVFDSPTRRIEVACDIFCIMVENECSLTFDDLFEYFAGKTLTAIFGRTLEEILLDMVDVLLTDEVGWTSLAFLFGTLSLGAKVGGVKDVGGFLTAIAAYIDETNNNWSLECDPCAPSAWCYEYDFADNDGGWVIGENADTWLGNARPASGQGDAGTYVGATGYETRDFTQQNATVVRSMMLFKEFSAPVSITSISVVGDFGNGNTSQVQSLWSITDTPGYNSELDANSGSGTVQGADVTMLQWVGDVAMDGLWVWIRPDANNPLTGSATLKRIVIQGYGVAVPDGATVCP